MKLYLSSSVGVGKTQLSAFDQALINQGIANTNLIKLSSVIPPNTEVVLKQIKLKEEDFGQRLYVVMAEQRTQTPGDTVAAGIGWVYEKNRKFGLFVEHEGQSLDKVKNDINDSLSTMVKNRPGYEFTKIEMLTSFAVCQDQPVCAMVCAAYELQNWSNLNNLE